MSDRKPGEEEEKKKSATTKIPKTLREKTTAKMSN